MKNAVVRVMIAAACLAGFGEVWDDEQPPNTLSERVVLRVLIAVGTLFGWGVLDYRLG